MVEAEAEATVEDTAVALAALEDMTDTEEVPEDTAVVVVVVVEDAVAVEVEVMVVEVVLEEKEVEDMAVHRVEEVVVDIREEIVVVAVVVEVAAVVVVEAAGMEIGLALIQGVGTQIFHGEQNVTNVGHPPQLAAPVAVAVMVVEVVGAVVMVAVITEEAVEGDMVVIEEVEEGMAEIEEAEGDMVVIEEGEVVTMKVEVVEAVEVVVLMEVVKEEMVVVMVRLLRLARMGDLMAAILNHQAHMLGTLIMEQMQFHHLQATMVDLCHIPHHMVPLVVMLGILALRTVVAVEVVPQEDMVVVHRKVKVAVLMVVLLPSLRRRSNNVMKIVEKPVTTQGSTFQTCPLMLLLMN